MNPPDHTHPGLFITLEGVDGVGKTTQLDLLVKHLTELGHDVLLTQEPAGTPLGAELYEWLRGHRAEGPTPIAEALLVLCARAQHVEVLIRPALAQGRTVVCSRFSHSTLAYQCYGLGLDQATVRAADAWARRGVWPDVVLILDAPREDVASRLGQRAPVDRIEARDEAFQERVREGFRELARQEPDHVKLVSALGTAEQVQAALQAALEPWLTQP